MLTSVIIPVFNRTKYLREAVESVLSQRGADFELIIVDDGSSVDVAASLADFRSRLTLLRQENRGLAAARNAGLQAASGGLVTFLDDDDRFRPGRLAAQAAALAAHPQNGFVFSRHAYFSDTMPPKPGTPPEEWLQDENPGRHLFKGNFMVVGAQTVRRELLEEAGPFDESLAAAEDWDMWLRLSRLTSFLFLDEILVDIRVHPRRMSDSPERMEMAKRRVLAKAFRETALPPPARQEAVRRLNQRLALKYYDAANLAYRAGALGRARRYFVRSIRLHPRRFLHSHAPLAILKSLMGPFLLDKARAVRLSRFPAEPPYSPAEEGR